MWVLNQRRNRIFNVTEIWKTKEVNGEVQIRANTPNDRNVRGVLLGTYSPKDADAIFKQITFIIGVKNKYEMPEE